MNTNYVWKSYYKFSTIFLLSYWAGTGSNSSVSTPLFFIPLSTATTTVCCSCIDVLVCVWQQHSKLFYMLLRVRTEFFCTFLFLCSCYCSYCAISTTVRVCTVCTCALCVVGRTLPGKEKIALPLHSAQHAAFGYFELYQSGLLPLAAVNPLAHCS